MFRLASNPELFLAINRRINRTDYKGDIKEVLNSSPVPAFLPLVSTAKSTVNSTAKFTLKLIGK